MGTGALRKQFGHYIVLGKIGSGAVANVYKATDSRNGQTVALKILHASWAEESDMVKRFSKEAEIVKSLQHPHIAAVMDYGVLGGRPYFAMQYMARGSLASRFAIPTPIGALEVVRLLRRVSSALDHAHRKGVVHRDIKLENILLDERGDAYLSDFGFARVTGAQQLTQTGSIVGTPMYMSPEQARGKKTVDYRADLYALGIAAYVLTVGRFPFLGSDLMVILSQHVSAEPPRPTELVSDLPSPLDNVMLKALAKRPEERYQTADAFIEAYAKVMADEQTRATIVNLSNDFSGVDTNPVNVDDLLGGSNPQLKAEDLVEMARTAESREDAITFLRHAVQLDPWHQAANRMLLKLEGRANVSPASAGGMAVPSTTGAGGNKPPSLARMDKLEDRERARVANQRAGRRRVRVILFIAALFMLLCGFVTLSVLGVVPGVIGMAERLTGGTSPITQVDGMAISQIPDAPLVVPVSQSRHVQVAGGRTVDVLGYGYNHEYIFDVIYNPEMEQRRVNINISFISLGAGNVAQNVAILNPEGQNMTSDQCNPHVESGILGGDSEVTFRCFIYQSGTWTVYILGIRGESVGAYTFGINYDDE